MQQTNLKEMSDSLYEHIGRLVNSGKKLLAILLDPEEVDVHKLPYLFSLINESSVTHIFVGGSTVDTGLTHKVVKSIKQESSLPVFLFPGSHEHLTNAADALLYLSLASGRNPEYLIEQHVKAVPFLKTSSLEVIPTGYILINGGAKTMVQKVSNTIPMSSHKIDAVVNTSLACQYLGHKLIYLEAGSGAKMHVPSDMITEVKRHIDIPLIVGGGIRTKEQLMEVYEAGADMVVIGTAFEENPGILSSF